MYKLKKKYQNEELPEGCLLSCNGHHSDCCPADKCNRLEGQERGDFLKDIPTVSMQDLPKKLKEMTQLH